MRRSHKLLFLIIALISSLTAARAHAWSIPIHRTIAEAAYERLTPTARAEIDRLITSDAANPVGGCEINSIADAAAWPDCVRGQKYFGYLSRWHYDNIPACSKASYKEYCSKGHCATATIARAIRDLKDRKNPDKKRLQALAHLSHFIADINQPLHAVDAYRGGNDISVRVPKNGALYTTNLHALWDDDIPLLAFDGQVSSFAINEMVGTNAFTWSKGDAAKWTSEAHAIAIGVSFKGINGLKVCGPTPTPAIKIDNTYLTAATPIAREQVAKSAVRLAAVLNDALR